MAELKKLGRYELKRVLGKGAMGVVYEGFDPTLGRRVAVKTILRNAAIDEETERAYSERFVREAKAVARLNHPHIVQVHDFGEENDVAFLVMEFIQGRELRSFFEAHERFEIADTVRIMGELLDALEFAHEAGVIHRDIKPANVMMDGQRRVKLADFGVARVQDSDRSAAGTMVGTPAFMSPEQISGGKIDRRTDVFSAGTILYQLLTGEQPFTGEGAWTVAKKIMQDEPPQPSSLVTNVSPAFDAIVARALAKKQSERYSTAGEFAAALRAVLGAAPASATAAPVAIPQQKKAKPASSASEAEVEFWKAIQNSTDSAEFEFYLEQFPEGTYAALARHKIARLGAKPDAGAESTVRLEAEAAERQRKEAEERAHREAEDKPRREAEEKARRDAEDKARRAAQAQAEAEARAKKVAEELAQRQAAALAKLKQQEQARKSAAVDPEATVALPQQRAAAAAPTPPAEQKKSLLVPVLIGALVIIVGAVAFFALNRKPAPAPVAEAPAPAPAAAAAPRTEVSAADIEKIKKETEERIRREYADKSAAEQAAAAKAATEKAIAEKQGAAKAAAEKQASARAAAEKAAAEKAMTEKLAAARQAGEKAALEKAAAEKAAAEKAASEKAAAEKAAAERIAAEKAAAQKAAAEKAAVEKAAAEKQAASVDAQLERFMQRHGRDKVMPKEPPQVAGAIRAGEAIYVYDGTCPRGQIKEVKEAIMAMRMGLPRSYRCIPLTD